jgi:threonyl-tRNA synthetase
MLHRAILGSLERFIGVYLEHTAGHLPVWISPTQVILLNVTDRVNDFCGKVLNHLKGLQIRAEFDQKSEKLNYKIRQAQLQKIPYMFIVGDKEAESGQVSLRLRSGENLPPLSWEKACQVVKMMIQNRTLDSSDIKTYWKQES